MLYITGSLNCGKAPHRKKIPNNPPQPAVQLCSHAPKKNILLLARSAIQEQNGKQKNATPTAQLQSSLALVSEIPMAFWAISTLCAGVAGDFLRITAPLSFLLITITLRIVPLAPLICSLSWSSYFGSQSKVISAKFCLDLNFSLAAGKSLERPKMAYPASLKTAVESLKAQA